MFGRSSSPVTDPALGELVRTRGRWRGHADLGGVTVPVAVGGGRGAPDAAALRAVADVVSGTGAWSAVVGEALAAHAEPYAGPMTSAEAWAAARAVFVSGEASRRGVTVEVGFAVPWDEEHTLGARFRDGRFVELNGSVPAG